MEEKHSSQRDQATTAGLLVALGIIYGDIGTSPLYVMKAIIGEGKTIDAEVVYGGLSCVFWTLTLQTTLKYVILTLRADNHGEGGIFALFALVRRYAGWLVVPAIIGGSALLADGIITPPISVASAVEGLRLLYPDIPTIPIVIGILTFLFLLQVLGTSVVGKAFGPLMVLWFGMLGTLGLLFVLREPSVLKVLNPYYAYRLLVLYPGGFWLLGGVFLCTTGAEALYSDLGHCGRGNIRVSWIFVKLCLLLNYLGQGAWLVEHLGEKLEKNPFFALMPDWFLIYGIGIATLAAIIASQALISGSFTLISEAMRLNFWPKVRILYPTDVRGQLYVPSINLLLWVGCVGIVLYFKESSNMEAAYGLAITLTMVMTTLLLAFYLYTRHYARWVVATVLVVYLVIEFSFLVANLLKFPEGGWVSLLIGATLAAVMYVWRRASQITERLTEHVPLKNYVEPLKELSKDITIPKYATHLIFISNTSPPSEIESKIMYSIFQKRPKRADVYWFVHIDILDEPYTTEYFVKVLEKEDLVLVTFRLGFRVEQRISLFLRKVIEEMVLKGEVDITSRYESLNKLNVIGDFRFILLERFLSYENELPLGERLTMDIYFFINRFTEAQDAAYGLDTSTVEIEKVPLVIRPATNVNLVRV
ncbi:MAG: KUP/HAK/KT family potassium transporter [Ferruginibacter sp.]|nr:KUP/HAK/KT family potassium transporter [Cytophagales bacterium]